MNLIALTEGYDAIIAEFPPPQYSIVHDTWTYEFART